MTAAKGYGGFSKGTVAEANAHIAALETRLEVLEAAVGDTINAPDISKTPTELTNGQWPLFWNVYQLRTVVGEIFAQLAGTPATPPPPAPNIELPPPTSAPIGAYGLPIQAMTQAQIDAFVPALTAGIGNGLSAEQVTKITSDVKAGVYAVQDVPTIDSVKYLYYNGGNQAALKPYLSAIDQRDLATNQLLPLTDPRVIQVSGIAGSGTPPPTPIPSGSDTVFPARVGVGGGVLKDIYGMIMQIFGKGDASLYLEANGDGSGPQLAGKLAQSDLSVSGGDGGTRLRQNHKNGKSADGIRPMGIVGFDSQANLSLQSRKVGEESIYGQDFWIHVEHANKTVDLVCPLPGYKLRICQTPAGAGYANSTDIR